MGHDEEPRTDQEQNGARTGAASTGTNEDMLAGSDPAPSQTADDARIDGPSRATRSEAAPSGAASSPTNTEVPALNKWQRFWRGVLHVDTAKMDPWTAA